MRFLTCVWPIWFSPFCPFLFRWSFRLFLSFLRWMLLALDRLFREWLVHGWRLAIWVDHVLDCLWVQLDVIEPWSSKELPEGPVIPVSMVVEEQAWAVIPYHSSASVRESSLETLLLWLQMSPGSGRDSGAMGQLDLPAAFHTLVRTSEFLRLQQPLTFTRRPQYSHKVPKSCCLPWMSGTAACSWPRTFLHQSLCSPSWPLRDLADAESGAQFQFTSDMS